MLHLVRMYAFCMLLLQVLFSENGLTWKYVKVGSEAKLFEGNPEYYLAIAHSFDPPLRVRKCNQPLQANIEPTSSETHQLHDTALHSLTI